MCAVVIEPDVITEAGCEHRHSASSIDGSRFAAGS